MISKKILVIKVSSRLKILREAVSAFIFGETHREVRSLEDINRGAMLIALILIALFWHSTHMGVVWLLHQSAKPLHLGSALLFVGVSIGLWLYLRRKREVDAQASWLYALLSVTVSVSFVLEAKGSDLQYSWIVAALPSLLFLPSGRLWLCLALSVVIAVGGVHAYFFRPSIMVGTLNELICYLYVGMFLLIYGKHIQLFTSKMREYTMQLRELAGTDQLTKVLTASAYYETCERLVLQCNRNQHPYSVLFIDVDHFKTINDTHGHAVGDHVLAAIAAVLKERLRSTDYLGRVGGEEFSAFLPNTGLDAAMGVAEHLRHAVQFCLSDSTYRNLNVTASIGVATGDFGSADLRITQGQADLAMYEAKRAGRNRVCSTSVQVPSVPI